MPENERFAPQTSCYDQMAVEAVPCLVKHFWLGVFGPLRRE